jgi:ABC-type uncharacterized transport system auxiliary subunit
MNRDPAFWARASAGFGRHSTKDFRRNIMSTRKNIIILFVIFLFVTFTSCLSFKQPNPEITYYNLEYDSPVFSGNEQLPYIIKIEPFNASPVYDTTSIIYREDAFKIESYTYYKWRVNPATIVTYLIGRDLKKSGLFERVMLPGERTTDVSFRLTGILDEFYELDEDKEWSGILSIIISLVPEGKTEKEGMGIFQKKYSLKEKCEKKNPESLAQALSRAMEQISGQIGEDLYIFIKQKMKS